MESSGERTRIDVFRFPVPDPKKDEPKVTKIPADIVKNFNLDTTYYKKHLDYKAWLLATPFPVGYDQFAVPPSPHLSGTDPARNPIAHGLAL